MPLQKLTFRPGLNREGTNFSNEGGWYDGDKIRFRSGQAEKIGGWIQVDSDQFLGYAKSLWTWIDVDGLSSYLSLGTNIKYYIFFGGSYYDITPIYRTDGTALSAPYNLPASPLATSNGSPLVTITDNNYNPSVGDYVIITTTASVGGLTISGEYVVTAITGTTKYQITASSNASSNATGGGTVTIQYEYPVGTAAAIPGCPWSSPSLLLAGQLARDAHRDAVLPPAELRLEQRHVAGAQPHRRAVLVADDQVLVVVDRFQLVVGVDLVGSIGAVEAALGRIGVGG
jgi:hypothetical protein